MKIHVKYQILLPVSTGIHSTYYIDGRATLPRASSDNFIYQGVKMGGLFLPLTLLRLYVDTVDHGMALFPWGV